MPPADMWDQLDAIITDQGPTTPPADSFCQEDIRNRYNIDRNRADRRIRKMRDDGKIITIGRFGNKTYYQLVKT